MYACIGCTHEYHAPLAAARRLLPLVDLVLVPFTSVPSLGYLACSALVSLRCQGLDHWNSANYYSLLFDPTASGITLLDKDDEELLKQIFWANWPGWIKIAVVRDPITRLLSAYLDLARTRESNANIQPPRGRRLEETRGAREDSSMEPASENALLSKIRLRGGQSSDTVSGCLGQRTEGCNEDEDALVGGYDEDGLGVQGTASLQGKRMLGGDGVHTQWKKQESHTTIFDEHEHGPMMPFGDFVEALKRQMQQAPPAFRPLSSMCGLRHAEYDSIIPFEKLQV